MRGQPSHARPSDGRAGRSAVRRSGGTILRFSETSDNLVGSWENCTSVQVCVTSLCGQFPQCDFVVVSPENICCAQLNDNSFVIRKSISKENCTSVQVCVTSLCGQVPHCREESFYPLQFASLVTCVPIAKERRSNFHKNYSEAE